MVHVELAFTVVLAAMQHLLLRHVATLKAMAVVATTRTARTTVAPKTRRIHHCPSLRTQRQASLTHHVVVPVVVFIDPLRTATRLVAPFVQCVTMGKAMCLHGM